MTIGSLSFQQLIVLALAALLRCLGLLDTFFQRFALAHTQLLSLLQAMELVAQLEQRLHAGEEFTLGISAFVLYCGKRLGLSITLCLQLAHL